MSSTDTDTKMYLLKILSSALLSSAAPKAIILDMMQQLEERLERISPLKTQIPNDLWIIGATLLRILCICEEPIDSSEFVAKLLEFDKYPTNQLIVKGFESASYVLLFYQDFSTFEKQWKDVWKKVSGDSASEWRKFVEGTTRILLGDPNGAITTFIIEQLFTTSQSKNPDILISIGNAMSIAFSGWYSENSIRFADLNTITHQRSKINEEQWRSELFSLYLQRIISSFISQSSRRLAACLWLYILISNCKSHSIVQVIYYWFLTI